METTPYGADRAKFLELVKTWKLSKLGESLYRDPSKRIAEGEALVNAPWISKVDETVVDEEIPAVRTGWYSESVSAFDGSFDDIAEVFDREDIADLIYRAAGGDERVVEAVLAQLEENEGEILLLAKHDSNETVAIQFESGAFFAVEVEDVDEEILSERPVSIQLLAQTANNRGEQAAPVLPGFPAIPLYQWNQQRMYEVLHSANVVLNSLKESNGDSPFVPLLEFFTKDLSEAIAELILDDETLTESEHDSVYEAFAGAFAGIHEQIIAGEPSDTVLRYVAEAKKRA